MPGLINLQTDLKSLRYGSDKPYITKDINNPPSSNQTGMQITKRIDDLSRISQMLIDRPGLKFLGNQALLQQIDIQDKLQKNRDKGNRTLAGAILQQALGTVKQTAKILGSTLAQVPVNGTGTHFVYAFRTDTYLQPSGGNIRSGFAQFFGAGGIEGAPLALRGELIEGEVQSNFGTKVSSTEFKVDVESKYDYDDYLSATRGDNQAKVNAQEGKPVLIPGAQSQTTVTPESLGISNQNVTGAIGSGEIKITPFKEDEEIRKSKSDTEQNIRNAQTGSIVSLKRERVDDKETTAASGDLGISNQNITSNFENPADSLGIVQQSTSKYTTESQYLSEKSYNGTELSLDIRAEDSNKTNSSNFIDSENNVSVFTNLGLAQGDTGNVKEYIREQPDNNSPEDTYSEKQKSRKINNTEKNAIKDTRINLGDQGRKKAPAFYTNFSNTDEESIDKLNALDIQNSRPDGINEARDLAKFFFEVITPEGSTFLNFRAFITSMDDSYNANWETKKYVGRADDFYTYGGFSRDISIGFRIAAATRSEMQPLYKKMIYLASTTAPTYGEYKFMRGTVVRLSLGSYFNEIPGVITSVKYTWNVDYPWEIAMESPEGGETGVQELPMIMDCSISFKPIHDFIPQTGLYHYITSKESGKTFF